MSYNDYKHIYVPTDFDIFGSGLVYRDVRRVWMKKTRATMRLELLKRLQENGLGLRQIELFVQNEAKFRLLKLLDSLLQEVCIKTIIIKLV